MPRLRQCGVLVFAATLAPACGSDSVTAEADHATTGLGDDDGAPGVADSSGDADSTADTGAATSPDPDDGGDESAGGVPPQACNVDCGNGYCDYGPNGDEICVCPNGEAAVGLTCLPCAKHEGGVLTDIEAVSIVVAVTIDGNAPPPSLAERGQLVLVDRLRGDEAVVGDTAAGPLAATVIPGDYELHWRHIAGSALVPQNSNASLGRVGLDAAGQLRLSEDSKFQIDEEGTLVVDIETVEIDIDASYNDTPAPPSLAENGELRLVDPATGDEVSLGETATDDLTARVIPGVYELHYAARNTASIAPRNPDAFVTTVDAFDTTPIEVTIPVVTLAGEFRFDGVVAPASTAERGRVALRDVVTGAEIDLGFTNEQTYSAPVVAGNYELVYRHVQGGGVVPRNASAILEAVQAAPRPATTGPQPLDVEIPTVAIAGAFTVGTAAPPTDPANVGDVTLRSPDSEDEVLLGETAAGAYAVRIVPATYDIFYSQKTSSGLVPANTNARLDTVDVAAGELPGDIDVPFAPVTGAVMLNGSTPPASEYDDGRIYLRSPSTGDSVLLGNTRLGSVDGLVVPGTYDVYYVVETAGELVPQNTGAYLDTVVVDGAAGLDLPVALTSYDLGGAITVQGAAAPSGPTDQALLTLEDVASDDTIFLGGLGGEVSAPLTAGTYVLYYQMLQTSGALPANQRAALACYVLGD